MASQKRATVSYNDEVDGRRLQRHRAHDEAPRGKPGGVRRDHQENRDHQQEAGKRRKGKLDAQQDTRKAVKEGGRYPVGYRGSARFCAEVPNNEEKGEDRK